MVFVHNPTQPHALSRRFSMRTSFKKSNLLGRKGSSSHQLVRIRDRGPAKALAIGFWSDRSDKLRSE